MCITILITHKASGVTWQSLVSFPLSRSSAQCCHLQILKGGEPSRLPLNLCSYLSCMDFLLHKGTGCSSLVSHHLQPKHQMAMKKELLFHPYFFNKMEAMFKAWDKRKDDHGRMKFLSTHSGGQMLLKITDGQTQGFSTSTSWTLLESQISERLHLTATEVIVWGKIYCNIRHIPE